MEQNNQIDKTDIEKLLDSIYDRAFNHRCGVACDLICQDIHEFRTKTENIKKFPDIKIGDIVYITNVHNETQDDIYFGIVIKLNEKYEENGKLKIFYLQNRWFPNQVEFDYSPSFNKYGWHLSEDLIEINKRRRSFSHTNGFNIEWKF